jgi:acyl-CoA thioesterase
MSDGMSGARSSLGIEVVSVGDGAAVCAMTVSESMLNYHGTCHGGVIFTLADSAFEFACNSYGPLTVAASASIDFLGVVHAGAALTATASETFRAGRSGLYDVAVRDGTGNVVAHFRGRSRTIER